MLMNLAANRSVARAPFQSKAAFLAASTKPPCLILPRKRHAAYRHSSFVINRAFNDDDQLEERSVASSQTNLNELELPESTSSSNDSTQTFEASEASSSSGDSENKAQIDLELPRRSLLVTFTCNKCGERTERLVNPLAWQKGLVIAQCAHCQAWHKLADAANLVQEYRFEENAVDNSDFE